MQFIASLNPAAFISLVLVSLFALSFIALIGATVYAYIAENHH